MSLVKEEYTEYFKKVASFSLPDFQLEFKLSYICARSIIDAYGPNLHYEDGFLYKYIEKIESDEDIKCSPVQLGDDADNQDDILDDMYAFLEKMKNVPERSTKKRNKIMKHIKNMPNYSKDDNTFGTFMNIKYPNGTPLILRFTDEEGCFFTDNGMLRKCILDIYSQNNIITRHVDDEIFEFLISSELKYENEEVISDISNFNDEDDLNTEIAYFVKIYESIFRKINKKILYEKLPVEKKMNSNVHYILRNFDRKNVTTKDAFEEIVMDIIERIVSIDLSIDRQKAYEYSNRLVMEAKQKRCSLSLISALERVVHEFETASDEEYLLLRKEIFS